MEEKRRYKRLPISLKLEVSEVFRQNNDVITGLNAEIEVFDISKNGIGFTTTTSIPEGYYFNSTMTLGRSDQKIMTVVKILHRFQLPDGKYRYGCEFVGMAGIFDFVFHGYEEFLDKK